MLRRTLALTALLTLALAIPVERSTPPPDPVTADPCAVTNTNLNLSPSQLHLLGLLARDDCKASPAIRIVRALFLPRVAVAQAVASAPGQTVADNPNAVVVADTGPGSVDTARAAVASASHSHAILWGSLFAIAVLIAGVWLYKRKNPEPRYGSTYGSEPGGGKERTRGGH